MSNDEKIAYRMQEYIDSIKSKVDIYRIAELYREDRNNQLKRDSELFKLVNDLSKNDWDPKNSIPLTTYPIELFDIFLTKEASKIYNTKTQNTVFEYSSIKFLFWDLNFFEHKLRFKFLSLFYNKWKEVISGLKIRSIGDRKCLLVQFISLEASITSDVNPLYFIKQLTKLFNWLVKNKIIKFAVLDNAFILPIDNTNKVVFNIFPVTIKCNNIKELNDIVGFDIFVREGSQIVDFNWKLIDNLK